MIIRVPASSANLGPGFDALGMALSIYADVGYCDDTPPTNATIADDHHPATIAFAMAGGTGRLWIRSSIPMGRGLGFSGAVRVAGVVAAHAQRHGDDPGALHMARPDLLSIASQLEGHPENAAASLFGGVVASSAGQTVRVPLAVQPSIIAWVPSIKTSTDRARSVLPDTVPFVDAVFNVGRTALLVASLASGNLAALRVATEDRLHQQQRLDGAGLSAAALSAALATDAWAAWLSGSGPTVLVLCRPGTQESIIAAMPAEGKCWQLDVDSVGARVLH